MPERVVTASMTPGRGRRLQGLRVFSSAADSVRHRRPSDVLLVLVTLVGLLVLNLPAPGPTTIDRDLTSLLHELGGFWDSAWTVSYALLAIWPLTLVVLALVSPGRRRLLADWVVASLLALGIALVVGRLGGTPWSRSLGGIPATGPPAVYVAAGLALATAVVVTASPHLSRPFRTTGRLVLILGAVAGVALGIAYPIGVLAGFAVGVAAGAGAHLLLGSPDGQLSAGEVADALAELGLNVTDVAPAVVQTPGTSLYTAEPTGTDEFVIKVYGRDAWDNQFLTSIWTALVRRGEHPHIGTTRRGQVEHEAVATLLGQQAGVPVPRVVVVGETVEGDAVLVTTRVGTPLSAITSDVVDERTLAAAWQSLVTLHGAGMAHGRIDRDRLLVLDRGRVALSDWSVAELNATQDAITSDRARLLVATATAAGHERAVRAAVGVLGQAGLAAVLPYLQPAALDRATRKAVKEGEWDLGQLRDASAEAAGVPPPALERLRRVTLKSAAIAIGGTLLAVLIVSKLLNVDYSSILQELSTANWWWLAGALLVSPTVQLATSFSTLGASAKPLRFGPVLMLQYAIQFLAVALPSAAARLALEVRFFERFGLAAAGALSIGLIDSLSGLVVQVLLIALIALTALPGLTSSLGGGSTSASSSSSGGGSILTVLIVLGVILLVAVITTLAVPRSRRRVTALVPRVRATIRSERQSARDAITVLRRPSKLAEMLGGNLTAQVIEAVMLGLCLEAFGAHAHLSQLILVNTLVSLFAGLMPVPGGVGVAEAGYVACLQAVGIPSAVAISTALAYRLVSFYLPPLWGSVAMGWLRRHQYV